GLHLQPIARPHIDNLDAAHHCLFHMLISHILILAPARLLDRSRGARYTARSAPHLIARGTRMSEQPATFKYGPLSDLRVIEMGTLLAGPFCGQILGDMGAEVIKIEPPGQGDPMRAWGREKVNGESLWWPV